MINTPDLLWKYRILLLGGLEMQMSFKYDFADAMKKPGYLGGRILSQHDRITDQNGKVVLAGQIIGWELIT